MEARNDGIRAKKRTKRDGHFRGSGMNDESSRDLSATSLATRALTIALDTLLVPNLGWSIKAHDTLLPNARDGIIRFCDKLKAPLNLLSLDNEVGYINIDFFNILTTKSEETEVAVFLDKLNEQVSYMLL